MKPKFRLTLFLALSLALLGGIAACQSQTPESQVQTATVKRGDLTIKVSADGNLALISDRRLTFDTSGKVAEVNVQEGDTAVKGQVLARLDTEAMERTIKNAELGVKAAELAMKSAEIDVQQAQEAVSLAEIDLELTSNNYQKIFSPNPYATYRFVVPESVDEIRVAEQRLKEAQDEFQKAVRGESYSTAYVQEKLAQAQEILSGTETKLGWGLDSGVRPPNADYWTLRALQLQVDKAKEGLTNARGTVDKAALGIDKAGNDDERAQSELERARDELGKAVIVSPFDGVIAKVNVKVGDILTSVNYATTTAIEVIDPSRMELTIKVDEVDIPRVSTGQKVSISLDALSDQKLEGAVTSISSLPDVEGGVVSYKVKSSFDIPNGLMIKAGMTGTADILIDHRSDVLLVPARAVKKNSEGASVVELVVNGKFEERVVAAGVSDGFETEILSGLSEGDIIVEARTKPTNSLFGA